MNTSSPKEKALIKIIVLGSSNVGKTALMTRFTTGKFSDLRRPTVGADFMTKRIEIHDIDVCLQVWDTAGQERFHQGSIGSSFYRGAHGAMLVYDVNNEKSIEQLALWKSECLAHVEDPDYFPIVVIGNKVDVRDVTDEADRIDQSTVLGWCKDNSYGHIETSAKEGMGVEAAMSAIAALALEAQRSPVVVQRKRMSSTASKGTIRLDNMYEKKKSSMCGSCL